MPQPWEMPRFIGFVDVLGYDYIARLTHFTDHQRFHHLHSIFENLAVSAHQVITDLGGPPHLRAVQFSDCFYFSSSSAVRIVAAMAHLFASVFTFVDHTFVEPPPAAPGAFPEWLPFLRGGIVYDWMFEGRDITLPALHHPADSFRNPIGPAVAKAYTLSERTGIEGMRLAVTSQVRDRFEEELPGITPGSTLGVMAGPLHPLFLKHHAYFGQIFEVPWFESRLQTNNTVGTFDTLGAAERQFDDASRKHLRGTWDGILRTPGVQANNVLRTRAAEVRFDLVRRMAHRNWELGPQSSRGPWHDWFVAEGIVQP